MSDTRSKSDFLLAVLYVAEVPISGVPSVALKTGLSGHLGNLGPLLRHHCNAAGAGTFCAALAGQFPRRVALNPVLNLSGRDISYQLGQLEGSRGAF